VLKLWEDGWFGLSALGFLASGVLFLYFYRRYHSAVEAADKTEASLPPLDPADVPFSADPHASLLAAIPILPEAESQSRETVATLPEARDADPLPAAQPADVPIEDPADVPAASGLGPAFSRAVFSSLHSAPEPADSGSGAAAAVGPERRPDEPAAVVGRSPAAEYLRDIKAQMDKFDKEIASLKEVAAGQAAQGERANYLLDAFMELKAVASQQAAQGEVLLQRLTAMAESLEAVGVQGSWIQTKTHAPEPRRGTPPAVRKSVPPAPAELPIPQAPAVRKSVPPTPAELPIPQAVVSAKPAAEPSPFPADVAAPAPKAQEPKVQAPQTAAETVLPSEPSQPRKGPVWPI